MKSAHIKYGLKLADPVSHYLEISIEIKKPFRKKKYLDLKLPVWRPGRYLVLEFASSIEDFEASNTKHKVLQWKKINKFTWRVYSNSNKSVLINYKVYANEFDLRTKGFDDKHAFVNPTSVFMYCDLYRHKPVTLQINNYRDWHVTTGLRSLGDNLFYSRNYDKFTDTPLEIGNQRDFDFTVDGKKHTISVFGEAKYDIVKLKTDFTKIISANYDFWGDVPYENYKFIIHCTPQSGGGTEHINSTVVGVKPSAFETEKGYLSFLRLISHEFFHTWNVKQLKPSGLTPYDFTRENYTSELWIAEGATSYYDGLVLRRTGQMSIDEFLQEVSASIEDERTRPGYRKQSVSDSSFDAWVKFWRINPNAYNSQSNYYTMGSYVCLILDLEIRNASRNKYSLDDVFREMYKKFPLDKRGYTNKEFRKTCEKYSGKKLKQFFDDYVFGTKSIEWEKYLLYAGIIAEERDQGLPESPGFTIENYNGKAVITKVMPLSPADKAGIVKGDEIIACNERAVTIAVLEEELKNMKLGHSIYLSAFRAGKLCRFLLKSPETHIKTYKLSKIEKPSLLQKEIFESWLNAKW